MHFGGSPVENTKLSQLWHPLNLKRAAGRRSGSKWQVFPMKTFPWSLRTITGHPPQVHILGKRRGELGSLQDSRRQHNTEDEEKGRKTGVQILPFSKPVTLDKSANMSFSCFLICQLEMDVPTGRVGALKERGVWKGRQKHETLLHNMISHRRSRRTKREVQACASSLPRALLGSPEVGISTSLFRHAWDQALSPPASGFLLPAPQHRSSPRQG